MLSRGRIYNFLYFLSKLWVKHVGKFNQMQRLVAYAPFNIVVNGLAGCVYTRAEDLTCVIKSLFIDLFEFGALNLEQLRG